MSSEQSPQIRGKALELLARREHSRQELLVKLSRRFPHHAGAIESELDGLTAEGLQSDARYTEAYTAMRKRRGYGPMRIRMELRERGVDIDLVAWELAKSEHDWAASAEAVWQKKFGSLPLLGRELARQIRFLQYRGFSSEQIPASLSR